ncbi:cistern family PEP-CTERM protein [Candidatus Nitrosacidococcus sp. I8]|uniref:cistern family PEP-CTERM protein n=1 Tax=Candidatus Nitrosacidococcus sp. I8 TaxID=2942908 RepID=UPI0022278AF9|nr:cistern family PEP-CTERM protein [Candidatus Nitrosacidococcus sp. I8]CAH9019246.1 hypothetical protein NURINAE_01420 [Candidatus Nitrosacidococcus sp. I8]
MYKKIALLATTTLLGFVAIPIQAVVITGSTVNLTSGDVGKSFDLNWAQQASGKTPALSASSTWIMDSFDTSTNTATFSITLDNTTDLATSGLSNAGITTFGFQADNLDFADSSITGDVFNNIGNVNGNFPGGFSVNTCVSTAGCKGGAQGSALAAGDSTSMNLSLAFGGGGIENGITLSTFPIKFQTSAGSYEFAASVSTPNNGNPTNPSVPEPSILWLFGAGLFALGWVNRRHNFCSHSQTCFV